MQLIFVLIAAVTAAAYSGEISALQEFPVQLVGAALFTIGMIYLLIKA